MSIYSSLNSKKDFLKSYFCLAKKHLEILCGNELAMQRKINLSIQLPNDNSSLLPIHSDVWSGCSPFEVVLWVPLVDVYDSKSMFIFPKNINDKVYKKFSLYKNSQILFDKYKKQIKFLNLKFGQGIIFAHSIIHGNIVNSTNETRWSFNCRFKSLMSPYYKKDIAETFVPISIKPATNIGLEYEHPKI
jgi:sporadic carbohydrate cluster 2OG-Fe(II) oxygenase